MDELVLTEEQQRAVTWLVEQLTSGVSLIALRGLAGTGKTTLIPALRQALAAADIPVAVGSPTHRAAMILRRKGIHDATTLHAQALSPYFTLEYAEAMAFLGEAVRCREDVWQVQPGRPCVVAQGLPRLIQERVRGDEAAVTTLKRLNRLYGAKKALESLGITGRDHFDGFGPKQGMGCLVIDEASMLGREQLTLCQQAFPRICLIGDPGQLPPVKDVRVLDEVPGFDLTQIHRQAADSPIIQLAYAARRGEPVWTQLTETPGAVERWRDAPAQTFVQVPLIVWRNETRKNCTTAIRTALYGTGDGLFVGEPLVCRASSADDREEGFYNNALFRVVEVSGHDPRQVTVLPDGSDDPDDARDVYVHMEEVHGDRIDPKAVVFRFGYCLTAHTAQGGEWPTVAISQPDLLAYSGFVRRKAEHAQELPQWTYTALTRARQCLGFLTQHLFTQATQVSVGPMPLDQGPGQALDQGPGQALDHGPGQAWPVTTEESLTMDITVPVPRSPASRLAPMFTAAPETADAPASADPAPLTGQALDDAPGQADDIPDGQVPASVVAAMATSSAPLTQEQVPLVDATMRLLEGKITDWVSSQSTATMKVLDQVYGHVAACLDKIAVANDHAQYQLANALDRLSASGVTVKGEPYTVTVSAVTPQGFPLTLTLKKGSADELAPALEAMAAWLEQAGYRAPGPGLAVPLVEARDLPF